MRIIGEIDHPRLKITVFQSGNRFAVKMEDAFLEQTYKFRQDENVNGFEDVKEMVDEDFLREALIIFGKMGKNQVGTLDRHLPPQPDEFEEIT